MLAAALSVIYAAVLPAVPIQGRPTQRVGRIIIDGNYQTPSSLIYEQLPARMRPGAKLYFRDLAVAQVRLRECGFFPSNPVNPLSDAGPTIEVIQNELDNDFLDILIRVNDRPGNWLRYELRQLLFAVARGNRTEVLFALQSLVESSYLFLWIIPNPQYRASAALRK